MNNSEQNTENMANKALESTIGIKPTAHILPGTVMTVIVARDIDFSSVLRTANNEVIPMTNPNDEQQVPGAEQDEDDNILIESTLVLDFLDQSGVTERLNRPGTTDVAINRPLEMWVDTPTGWQQETAPWLTYNLCWRLANSLAALNHRELAAKTPIHTVELPGGERGQIVMAPACEKNSGVMYFVVTELHVA